MAIRSITRFAVTGLTTIVLLVGGLILVANRHINSASIRLCDQYCDRLHAEVLERTIHFLEPASRMAVLSAALSRSGTVNLADIDATEPYMIDIIGVYTQLAMSNLGYENGNFLMARKLKDGGVATKTIFRDTADSHARWIYRNEHGDVTETMRSDEIAYDPREREWYQGAKSTGTTFWSDLYIFFTDKTPGITAAHPVVGPDNRFIGVIGLDIELSRISRVLEAAGHAGSGVSFILNADQEAVAYPHRNPVIRTSGDDSRSALIHEVAHGWVVAGCEAFAREGRTRFVYDVDNVQYMASFSNLPHGLGKDWVLATIVPVDAVVGSVGVIHKGVNIAAIAVIGVAVICLIGIRWRRFM